MKTQLLCLSCMETQRHIAVILKKKLIRRRIFIFQACSMGFASQFLTELCCQQGLFYTWHLEKNIIWRFQLVTQINCQVWLCVLQDASLHIIFTLLAPLACVHTIWWRIWCRCWVRVNRRTKSIISIKPWAESQIIHFPLGCLNALHFSNRDYFSKVSMYLITTWLNTWTFNCF